MMEREEFLRSLTQLGCLPEGVDNECGICQESFSAPTQLPCQHLFCRECIFTWLKPNNGQNTCPYCRTVLFGIPPVAGEQNDEVAADHARLTLINQAIESSGLSTNEFERFGFDHLSTEATMNAAGSASSYLRNNVNQRPDGPLRVDKRYLKPHIVAMANLLAGYAEARGRPNSDVQLRDWHMIVNRLYVLVSANNRETFPQADGMQKLLDFRRAIRIYMRVKGIEVAEGGFFPQFGNEQGNDGTVAGDLFVLIHYVADQCARNFRLDESIRQAHREAQQEAIEREAAPVGRVLRRAGQVLFDGI